MLLTLLSFILQNVHEDLSNFHRYSIHTIYVGQDFLGIQKLTTPGPYL